MLALSNRNLEAAQYLVDVWGADITTANAVSFLLLARFGVVLVDYPVFDVIVPCRVNTPCTCTRWMVAVQLWFNGI